MIIIGCCHLQICETKLAYLIIICCRHIQIFESNIGLPGQYWLPFPSNMGKEKFGYLVIISCCYLEISENKSWITWSLLVAVRLKFLLLCSFEFRETMEPVLEMFLSLVFWNIFLK